MCQSAITLVTNALPTVNDDEKLLKIKGRIALFMQTMQVSDCRQGRSKASGDQQHKTDTDDRVGDIRPQCSIHF